MLVRILLVASLLAIAVDAAEPRVCSLRKRSLAELKVICGKASVEFAEDADAESLRAALFKKMQEELPETVHPTGTPLQEWPGPGQPGECDSPAAATPASAANVGAGAQPSLDNLAAALFGKLDANSDGQLSREELQGFADKVNAEAHSRGEPEYDLFKSLDRDLDGKVSRSEADETFKAMGSTTAPPKPSARKPASQKPASPKPASQGKTTSQGGGKRDAAASGSDVAEMMFERLDADEDGRLSKKEMKSVLEQYEADAKAKGEEVSDFWTSLDTSRDDFVDKKEAHVFFEAMAAALGKDKQEL